MPITLDFAQLRNELIYKFPQFIFEDVEDAFSLASEKMYLLDKSGFEFKSPEAYMYTIMKNELYLKSIKRKLYKAGENIFTEIQNANIENVSREEQIDNKGKVDPFDTDVMSVLFDKLLPHLTPRQKKIIELYKLGKKDIEIASIAGCSRSTVRVTKMNAIKALMALIDKRNPE